MNSIVARAFAAVPLPGISEAKAISVGFSISPPPSGNGVIFWTQDGGVRVVNMAAVAQS